MFKKPISTKEGGVLAALFRKVILENNLQNAMDYLIAKYVDNTKHGATAKNLERKTKSSLIKYITAEDMSWKTFLTLMFDFVGARKIEFTIKVTLPNGNKSIHTTTVRHNIVDKNETLDEKEKDAQRNKDEK